MKKNINNDSFLSNKETEKFVIALEEKIQEKGIINSVLSTPDF